MSTESERLEGMVWLESTHPDIPEEQQQEFLEALDDYYRANPIADRFTDPLTILEDDTRAFIEILYAITRGEHPRAPSVDAYE